MMNLDEYRICMHYGCDENKKKFKESENNKMKEKNKKNCKMHPGKYDFGHTGYKKVSEFTSN